MTVTGIHRHRSNGAHMAQQQGTPETGVTPSRPPIDGERFADPAGPSSPIPPQPQAADEPSFANRIGPKPRYPTFSAMLRAEPAKTLRWLLWGGAEHADFFRG